MAIESALIVDDSKLARITLRKKLQRHGVEADMAESAKEALDLIQKSKPQIVFMDHLMPEMDGFEATKVIRAMPDMKDLPIIMCTGKDHEGYLQEAQAVGANSTLTKPPTEDTLASILSTDFFEMASADINEAKDPSLESNLQDLAALEPESEPVENLDEAVSALNDIALTLEGVDENSENALDITLDSHDSLEAEGSLDALLDGLLSEDSLLEEITKSTGEDFTLDLSEESSLNQIEQTLDLSTEAAEEVVAVTESAPAVEINDDAQAAQDNLAPVVKPQDLDLSEIKADIEKLVKDSVAIAVAEKVAQTVASSEPQIKTSVLEDVNRELHTSIDDKISPVKTQLDEAITRLTSEVLSLGNQSAEAGSGLSETAVNTLVLQKLQLLWKKTNKLVDSRLADLPTQASGKDFTPVIAAIETQIAQLQEAQFKPEQLDDDEENLLVDAQADQIRQLQVELLETKNSVRSAKIVGFIGVLSGFAAAGVVAARLFGYI